VRSLKALGTEGKRTGLSTTKQVSIPLHWIVLPYFRKGAFSYVPYPGNPVVIVAAKDNIPIPKDRDLETFPTDSG